MSRSVVIGLGDARLGDGGVGLAVVRALRRLDVHGAHLATSDGEPTRLCDLWGGADVAIVVDAAGLPAPQPGRVHRRSLRHPSVSTVAATSSHGRCLDEAVALSVALDRLPGTLLLYVVEPADLRCVGLSPAVRAAVEPLASEIAQELAHRIAA